ncbi:hypothetical protein SBRCBS47491_006537 [Sporothrix bragantina]|uniref:Uncharacterized protein n=1 Tax=Sporothrix bragantina TaxID=671064 RepID=A0ABP0C872_9PEZI
MLEDEDEETMDAEETLEEVLLEEEITLLDDALEDAMCEADEDDNEVAEKDDDGDGDGTME